MSEPNMLEVSGLRVAYGAVVAVDNINISVPKGSVVALVGPNGAGKTSALRAIGGQERSDGAVVLDGLSVAGWRPHKVARAGLAQVPQGRRVFVDLPVSANLELGGWSVSPAERERNLERVYENFPILAERGLQLAGSLSGGEQQMLSIGRALMASPKLIAMDEPSLGLAPIIVKEVFATIEYIREQGVSVLLVEQNATQALASSDFVYVMNHGKVVYSGRSALAMAEFDLVESYLS